MSLLESFLASNFLDHLKVDLQLNQRNACCLDQIKSHYVAFLPHFLQVVEKPAHFEDLKIRVPIELQTRDCEVNIT